MKLIPFYAALLLFFDAMPSTRFHRRKMGQSVPSNSMRMPKIVLYPTLCVPFKQKLKFYEPCGRE